MGYPPTWAYLHFSWHSIKGLLTSKGSLSVSTKTTGKADDVQKRPGSRLQASNAETHTHIYPVSYPIPSVDVDETLGAWANPCNRDGASGTGARDSAAPSATLGHTAVLLAGPTQQASDADAARQDSLPPRPRPGGLGRNKTRARVVDAPPRGRGPSRTLTFRRRIFRGRGGSHRGGRRRRRRRRG